MGPERSERERERASIAGGQLGRVRCGPAQERSSGPSEQAARCSRGQAAGTGQREEEGEKGRAS